MNNGMRASLWRIYLVAATAPVGGYFLLPDDWWQTGVGAAIALAGPAGLLVGVWLHRPRRRRLWWMFAAGLSCIAAGLVGWDGQEASDRLVARADRALYTAKAGGRDRVTVDRRQPAASDRSAATAPPPR